MDFPLVQINVLWSLLIHQEPVLDFEQKKSHNLNTLNFIYMYKIL